MEIYIWPGWIGVYGRSGEVFSKMLGSIFLKLAILKELPRNFSTLNQNFPWLEKGHGGMGLGEKGGNTPSKFSYKGIYKQLPNGGGWGGGDCGYNIEWPFSPSGCQSKSFYYYSQTR